MEHSRIDEMTDLLQRGLKTATKNGASAAKITYWQHEQLSCSFENARIKSTGSRQSLNYSVAVIIAGKRGIAQGNDVGDMDDIIGRAVSLARIGSVAHFSAYPAPGTVTRVKTHSPKVLELTRDGLIESCTAIADELKRFDAGMDVSASGGRSESEALLVTTGGVCHVTRDTGWWLHGEVQRVRGTDMLFAGEFRGGSDMGVLYDPAYITGKILTDLRRGEHVVDPPSGTTTVILSPECTEMFLWPLGMATSGRNVAKGESPLNGRIGEKILDSSVTIIDDPHVDFASGAREIDGDGIPTRKFEVVREGVLKAFLYDLDSAGLAGAEPTGHGGCDLNAPCLLPGPKSRDELMDSIEDGLYIKGLIGFGQSNMMNGDISGNIALGFRIKNGKIAGRVKDTMVSGNFYELLKRGVELSSEIDPIKRMPYMKLVNVAVSSGKK